VGITDLNTLAIYGVGGVGREVLELAGIINRISASWRDFVFIDDGDVPSVVRGIPVYKYEEAKALYGDSLEIAIGVGEPTTREKLFAKIASDGFYSPTLIHPNVYIPASTTVGNGIVIQSDCFVSCDVTIKDHVYLQPRCNVGHDCVLEEGCIISAFGNLAGAVHIGRCTYIGMGVAIKELVSIGDYTIIGMSSSVYKDIPDNVIAVGNPARPMKNNDERKVFKHSGN